MWNRGVRGGLKLFVLAEGYMKAVRRVDLKNCVP
jgi:hypothetical protein